MKLLQLSQDKDGFLGQAIGQFLCIFPHMIQHVSKNRYLCFYNL